MIIRCINNKRNEQKTKHLDQFIFLDLTPSVLFLIKLETCNRFYQREKKERERNQ